MRTALPLLAVALICALGPPAPQAANEPAREAPPPARVEVKEQPPAPKAKATPRPLPAPKPLSPIEKMESPAIRALLKRIHDELPDAPPASAELVRVVIPGKDDKGKTVPVHTFEGWRLPGGDDHAEIQLGLARVAFRMGRGFPGEGPEIRHLREADKVREFERILARAGKGRLPGMGEGAYATEIVLAWWLDRRAQPALAARILLPLLARCERPEELLDDLRAGVAVECEQRMFDAFAITHDYKEALRWGRRALACCPDTPHAADIKRLLDELPHRMDDHKDLRLPTPDEWKEIQASLTREEQIDYLCRRLRLAGAPEAPAKPAAGPARTSPWEQVDSTPMRLAEFRSGTGKKRINPLRELKVGLKVTVKDVPTLNAHLRHDWVCPDLVHEYAQGPALSWAGIGPTTRQVLTDLIASLPRNELLRARLSLAAKHARAWIDWAAKLIDSLMPRATGLSGEEWRNRLNHGSPAVRTRAAARFLSELKQHLLDERASQLRKRPDERDEFTDQTREREELADALASGELTPEVLPLVHWFLDEEPCPVVLGNLPNLLSAKSAPGRALALRVARKPPRSASTLSGFLRKMASLELALPDEDLARLAQHSRPAVREAAHELARALDRPKPAEFGPLKAMNSPAIRSLLKRVHEELPDAPPLTARLVSVTVEWLDSKGAIRDSDTTHGWLLAREADRVVVQSGLRRITIGTVPVNDFTGTLTSRCRVAPVTTADEVRRLERARKDDPDDWPTASSQLVMAWWLDRTGQTALAARALFPLLADYDSDEKLLAGYLMVVGDEWGERMFEAFGNSHDYRDTLRLAGLIVRRYPASSFVPEARKLLAELPRRLDDFKELKLPALADWAALKNRLTREEQVDFLCRRLRLVGFDGYGDQRRFAEPAGPDFPYVRGGPYVRYPVPPRTADRNNGKGRTQVVNPLSELGWKMKLGPKDIPALVRHLPENWLLVSILQRGGYGSGGGPPTISSASRELVVEFINEAARGQICRFSEDEHSPTFAGVSEASEMEARRRGKEAERWARAHAWMGPADLEWHWLQQGRAAGESWGGIKKRALELQRLGDPRGPRLMHSLLRDRNTTGPEKADILGEYVRFAPRQARYFARFFLNSPDAELRTHAAILCLQTSEADRARALLGDFLSRPGLGPEKSSEYLRPVVVAELMADGAPASVRAACRVLDEKVLASLEWGLRGWTLRALARRGRKEGYAYYLPRLRNTTAIPGSDPPQTVAEVTVLEICNSFGYDDPAVQEITRKYEKPSDRVPHLEKWLKERIAEERP
jgi:hypothetical protein